MKLVIVESPAKAKKIAEFLDDSWRVEACRGHVCDLPETELGVEVAQDFRPQYGVLPGKGNLVRRLVRAMRRVDEIYLATDPDREGEAIAWHLLQLAGDLGDKPVHRARFTAITRDAVRSALAYPAPLNADLVAAQNARRVVDRLVGYLISPLASQALDGRFSAGRVQSAALRLVVEREREIAAFQPQTAWTLSVQLATQNEAPQSFEARLMQVKGEKRRFSQRQPLDQLAERLATAQFWVGSTQRVVRAQSAPPPFTTASLQQAASAVLDLSPERSMAVAQMLYEQGWITYPRTDGVEVAPEAQSAARDLISERYGTDYLPPEPPRYVNRALNAQEAHEAIRPTDVHLLPDENAEEDVARLYNLIWRRFVASQMTPALIAHTRAVIYAGKRIGQAFPLAFHARGRIQLWEGYRRLHGETATEESSDALLPQLRDNQPLTRIGDRVDEHVSRPPQRYSEASLIAALEQRSIGRPATYAGMVAVIQARGYVAREGQQLRPTPDGERLADFLTTHFDRLFASDATALLEAQLDQVAAGKLTRSALLESFWDEFQPRLAQVAQQVNSEDTATERGESKPLVLHPTNEQPIAEPATDEATP